MAMIVTDVAIAAGPINQDAYDRCRAIVDDQARLRCFEGLTAEQPETTPAPRPGAPSGAQELPDSPEMSVFGPKTGPASLPVAGKWRLVRTRNPVERHDVVSIMATAELATSDVDFAGLNLRCAEPDFEIMVFLIPPLPPQARPMVTLNGKTFQGTVVSPFTAILLPRAASVLAKEQWKSQQNVSIDVVDDGTKTHGLVSLEGFDKALQTLTNSCLSR